ncbi:hypothetical protein HJC23_008547 [Cyclotella cryptica]|uniref:SET domain-containing protein n=1 Tax=Cyclotella cryptica TaxID=29204 RepID=A0ABD3P0D5_9STRA|eukprot:CCRYP_018342-RA/>CCRYP_018342-RA protein AED:0.02 eAED:0.02 QI:95/1/1/1/1/1/3/324/616
MTAWTPCTILTSVLLLSGIKSNDVVDASASSHDNGVFVEHPECRLFLAESTIPNAGLGIFTGVPLGQNESIAEPDLIVPLTDYEWNARDDMDFHFLWIDYSWMVSEVGMETDMYDGCALVIGTGCMPNCNYALINAYEGKPSYNHLDLHRSRDPGVFGFTGFHNQKMITTQPIPAGGEIFVAYGEHWFLTRPDEMGTVPLPDNFEIVDDFLKRFKKLRGKYQQSHNPDFTKDLWDAISFVHNYETRNTNALPRAYEDLQEALVVGSARSFLPYSVRSLEWLKDHGRCMDNIRPGNSTIKQAGRGAFASRFIPKGGLVAPGPLLHIPNKTALNIYEIDPHTEMRDTSRIYGKQLILNYCFGHRKSTLLLCPYTSPSAYINHNSESPNARVVWAREGTPNFQHDWLNDDIDFLKTMEIIGLSVDFIATRDIQPGEEVFIDYGQEWEEAWNAYIKVWKRPAGSQNYFAGSELQSDLSIPLRTSLEQQTEPYSDNVVFYCHYEYYQGWPDGIWNWEATFEELPLYPCKITSRKYDIDKDGNVQYHYNATMLTSSEVVGSNLVIPAGDAIPDGETHTMTDIPRSAIEARDKMYSKNEYMPNSFRHEMMMPDDMFPASWINL